VAKAFTFVHRFIHDESGSYLVFGTILMPVLIGVAALGTEGAQVITLHRQAQAAADSAAVSVASYYASQKTAVNTPTSTELSNQAKAVASTYGFVDGTNGASVTVNNPPASGNFTTASYAFQAIVSQSHTPLLSSYWLSNAMTVSAKAVALINTTNGSSADCLLALGNSSTGANLTQAVWGQGNGRLNLSGGCSLADNSSDPDSVYLGPKGSAAINLGEVNSRLAGRVSTVGNYDSPLPGGNEIQSCTSITGSPPATCNGPVSVTPITAAGAVPDPFAGATIPSASLATCSNLSTLVTPWNASYMCTAGNNTKGLCFSKNSTNVTLSPGTYCGGISISKGNATYTLNPGVYVLASTNGSPGLTDSNGTVTMNGTGVTLVFTSADGTYPPASNPIMNIPNAMTLNLTAPTSGSTAGFVIMGDSSMPLGTAGQNNSTPAGSQFVFNNGATGTLNGVVYVPKGALSATGNGQINSTGCLQVIANVFNFNNSGGFTSTCRGGSAPTVLVGAIPLLVE
jgi:Flp pilus assembly protein TadG